MSELAYLSDVSHDVEPSAEQVLDRAKEHGLAEALVIGLHPDGTMYFHSSIPDGSDVVWLLEKIRFLIMLEAHNAHMG